MMMTDDVHHYYEDENNEAAEAAAVSEASEEIDLIHHHHNNDNNDGNAGRRKRLEQILLFGSGLGSSLSYIATLSSLVYFKVIYGPDSYVDLNLAVYLPLLPVSLLQAKYDIYYDSVFQTRNTFLFRGVVSFVLILYGQINMLLSSSSTGTLTSLIWNATLQGTGGAVLYGTLNQLASFLGTTDEECRTSKAAISAGVQASALLVLIISVLSGFGITNNGERFPVFLTLVLAMQVLCLLMFLYLILNKRSSVTASMVRRDSTLQLDDSLLQPSTLPVMEGGGGTLYRHDDDDDDAQLLQQELQESLLVNDEDRVSNITLSYWEIWNYSKLCCCILIGTLIPSFLVGSWFTHVETEWIRLPQILFYTRIAADLLGRLATIYVPPTNLRYLAWTCLLRFIPVCFFFAMNHCNSSSSSSSSTWNVTSTTTGIGIGGIVGDGDVGAGGTVTVSKKRDMVSIGLVAIIAFLSGYLVTGCYQVAPQSLPEELQQSSGNNNLTKQASLLTVAFSIAAILGLLSSFTLVAIGY